MRPRTTPTFEYDRAPALWGGAATVALGAAALFAFHSPMWVFAAGLVGGAVAGARSGFYAQSANNGLVGALLGLLALYPVLFLYRTNFLTASGSLENVVFLGVILAFFDLLVYALPILVFGYLGAALVDATRQRSGGRIGY